MRTSVLARLACCCACALGFAACVDSIPTRDEAGAGSGGASSVSGGQSGGAGSSSKGGAQAGTVGGDETGVEAGGESGCPSNDCCPDDPEKTEPGECGCGFPDVDSPTLPSCTGLASALVHRYDFEGTGSDVTDRIGTAHGSVQGATLSVSEGKGVLVLSGGASGPYVNLPNGLLSSLDSATIEAWVTWDGGNPWQRVFDFGDTNAATPEDTPLDCKSCLFLACSSDWTEQRVMRVSYLSGGSYPDSGLSSGDVLPVGTLAHVAVVVDDLGDTLSLYLNGQKQSDAPFTGRLSVINDINAWLGRSQFDVDTEFSGTFHEFRIYDAALSQQQIAASFAFGPDPAFLAEIAD